MGSYAAHISNSLESANRRIKQLESAIRAHRDQRGDDRCWLDDHELYKTIDGIGVWDSVLPKKCEFLESCSRYWEQRQSPGVKSISEAGGMTIRQIQDRIAELEEEIVQNELADEAMKEQCKAPLKRLSDYQHLYSHYTHGCDMPGNDLYSGILMSIVRDARAVLGPESERPLSGEEMELILSDGRKGLDVKEKA